MFKKIFTELCTQKGIAPTVVCQKVGLSNATYSCWTEDSVPRQTTLLKIADYFGVSVNYLLGKEDKKKTPSKVLDPSAFLSAHEQAVISAYRAHPEMQPAVDRLLGVTDENTVTLFAAAYSEDNLPEGIVKKDKEQWQKIQNAPETDDPLV